MQNETSTTRPTTIAEGYVRDYANQPNSILAAALQQEGAPAYESNEESSPFSPMVLTFGDGSTLSIVGWDDDDDDTPILTAGTAKPVLTLQESHPSRYGARLEFNTPTNGYLNNLTYGMTDSNADGDAFAVVTEFSYESPEPYTADVTAAMEELIMTDAAAKGYSPKSVLWLTGSNIWD